MWKIDNLIIQARTLDFGSSEQSHVKVSQLFAGSELLVNALELVDWDSDETQLLVCEACGSVHCKSGDWVMIRKSGPLVLILPAFDSLEKNVTEYGPPVYVRERGIGFLDLEAYEELRSKNVYLPATDSIRQLEMRETVKAFQWDAPLQIFGRPPQEFARRGDLIVASSTGDHAEWTSRIEAIARANQENHATVTLRPLAGDDEPVSLFLDTAEFLEWKAMTVRQDSPHLLLGDYVIAANGH